MSRKSNLNKARAALEQPARSEPDSKTKKRTIVRGVILTGCVALMLGMLAIGNGASNAARPENPPAKSGTKDTDKKKDEKKPEKKKPAAPAKAKPEIKKSGAPKPDKTKKSPKRDRNSSRK